jgi:hypothetical protein
MHNTNVPDKDIGKVCSTYDEYSASSGDEEDINEAPSDNEVSDQTHDNNSKQREIPPLPTLPCAINSVFDFYKDWQNRLKPMYDAHKAYARETGDPRSRWLDVFGKEYYKVQKMYWTKYCDWLFYMDSLSHEKQDALLSLLDDFAVENGISKSSLIKIVFYHAVRPDGKVPHEHVKNVVIMPTTCRQAVFI